MGRFALSVFTLICMIVLASSAWSVEPQRFTVDLEQPQQRIVNFAASDAWYSERVGSTWPDDQRNAIADLLFSQKSDDQGNPSGIGLSAWRFNIGGGSAEQGLPSRIGDPERRVEGFLKDDGTYDWSAQSGQRWFLQAAQDRGVEQLIGFVNSPPVQFTRNGLGRKTEKSPHTNLAPEHFADYAKFLADVALDFESKGLSFDWISPVNEPQWDWSSSKQEGTPWTNEEISRVVHEIDRQFQSRDVSAKLLLPECAELDYAYGKIREPSGNQIYELFNSESQHSIIELPTVEPIFASHGYFVNDSRMQMIEERRRTKEAIDALPEPVDYWASEYCILSRGYRDEALNSPPSAMDCALFMAQVIHADLVLLDSSTWHFWTSMDPKQKADVNVRYCLIALDQKNLSFKDSRLLWALGHWSRFVRPGWHRLQVGADSEKLLPEKLPRLMVSAFASKDSSEVAVVVVNQHESEQHLQLDIKGASGSLGGGFTPYLTTVEEGVTLQRQAVSSGASVVVPPRSITTFIKEAND